MNAHKSLATVFSVLCCVSLALSGCGSDDGDVGQDRAEDKTAGTDAVPREQEQTAPLPARTIRSEIPFAVFVHPTREGLLQADGFLRPTQIGQTGPDKVVQIPPCYLWYVEPADPDPDWQKIAVEVARIQVPGLQARAITESGLSHLASLKHLTYLAVSESDEVADTGLEPIADLENLQVLILSGCDNLTDACLGHAEELERIQVLVLNCTRFTGAALEHVKGLKNLQMLWADFNNTEPDLEHVEGLEKLQALILMEARTTDAELEHVKGLKNLEQLMLESANITDAGLKHIESLTNLKMFYFDAARCTEAGVESLRRALPDCEVERQ